MMEKGQITDAQFMGEIIFQTPHVISCRTYLSSN